MIQFDHVSKHYGEFAALKDLSLSLENGEIFGLIGHNGAGKTTSISLLTSIIEPTSGQILVDSLELSQHRDAIKKRIAYVPDSPDIFLNLTAREYWNFLAKVYGVEQAQAQARMDSLSRLFDIQDRQD